MVDRTWWVVARREFFERVRSRWFVASTILGPVLLVGLIVVPAFIARSDTQRKRVHVVAHCSAELAENITSGLGDAVENLDATLVEPDTERAELVRRIRDEEIEGFLILPADLLGGGGQVEYRGVDASNFEAMAQLQMVLQLVVTRARLADVVPDKALVNLLAPIRLDRKLETGEGVAASGTASFLVGYIVAFVLYMAILLYAISVMRSVLLEKTSRVVELVVSSIKPSAFMAGKIGGVGTVGLLQLAIWAVAAAGLFRYRNAVLAALGLPLEGFELPPVGLDDLALILVFFVLGYFLFAALYAAVGAMCSTEQEAQQAQMPVVMLAVIPMLLMRFVTNNPRGEISAILTQIPFAAPILMPMRLLLGGANASEVLLSITLLVATTAALVWLAARIYRVGILLHGKRPTLRELARWVRQG